MADLSKVGTEYPPIIWEVERGKIRELAKAIRDPNPAYLDREAAVVEGYKDTPAPPTFCTVPTDVGRTRSARLLLTYLKYINMMVLHGEEEYEYYQQIYPGDVITGVPKVVKMEEKTSKSGAKMDMITMEILYTNQTGKNVAKARTLVVERK